MGGINKHGSCNQTRAITTNASKQFSLAFASMMQANAELENVLLAELDGKHDKRAASAMIRYLKSSQSQLIAGRKFLDQALVVGEETQAEYRDQFKVLQPAALAELWNYKLLLNCEEEVCSIGKELIRDNLAPTLRFVRSVDELYSLTEQNIATFEVAALRALSGDLQKALENNELSLQADFAKLLSRWLQFMKQYLVESLLATEVIYQSNKVPSFIES